MKQDNDQKNKFDGKKNSKFSWTEVLVGFIVALFIYFALKKNFSIFSQKL